MRCQNMGFISKKISMSENVLHQANKLDNLFHLKIEFVLEKLFKIMIQSVFRAWECTKTK